MGTMYKNTWLILLLLIIPISGSSATLREAMDRAAEYFVKSAVKIDPGQELHVVEVVNFSTKENDVEGKVIETEIYFALERQFPDFKLFLGRGPNKDKEIYLAGSYEMKGDTIVVKLRVFKEKEILAQTEVEYATKAHRKTLVAVLDLEAEDLNSAQRKAFSDIFRTKLLETRVFDLASSADIDKMNPDEIQKATGCSRDSCATIVGEQLGVDRVISSSLFKVGDSSYVLSAKMIDIQDGSILITRTVDHQGNLTLLKHSLENLALQMVNEVGEKQPEIIQESSSELPWHITAVAIMLTSAWLSVEEAQKYNNLYHQNQSIVDGYRSAITTSQLISLQQQYDDNLVKMEQHDRNIQVLDAITVLAVLWEAYLLFYPDQEDSSETSTFLEPAEINLLLEQNYTESILSPRLILVWKW